MFLRVLNINLDHYDFPVIFAIQLFVIKCRIVFCYSATNEDKLTPLQCKKISCQSLTRVVASLEVHTTAITTANVVVPWTICW